MKKLFLILTIIFIMLSGCSKKEIKEDVDDDINPKTNQSVKFLVEQSIKAKENNTTLSNTVENSGIIIDGAKDEALFDAFGLAVSQIIVEEGVSVPSCAKIAETGYLSQDDCNKITEKYFGFYEIGDDGTAKKVDDLFFDGVAGEEINIREAKIEYFDNRNNPLLGNFIKLKEIIKKSTDLTLLKSIKNSLPLDDTMLQKELDKKILLLGGTLKEPTSEELRISLVPIDDKLNGVQKPEKEKQQNNSQNNEKQQNTNQEKEKNLTAYTLISSQLLSLKSTHESTKTQMQQDANNAELIKRYNQEEMQIAALEQELNSLKAGIL